MILGLIAASTFVRQTAPEELKVMTYNLRYSAANDGEDAWPKRKEALLALIKKQDPDVLGVQEALADQIDELKRLLPDHSIVGVGRDDGLRKGEYSAIFTRQSKLGMRTGGTHWISPNPLQPGSLASDAKITRIFSWGEFFTASGKRILLMNCHLDHQSTGARLLGGQQMRAFADEHPGIPTIITGDFNTASTDAPIQTLLADGRFTEAIPKTGPFGTFNAFKPTATDGAMIDHIFTSPGWETLDVTIDRTLYNNRTPSDHFPVVARIRLK